MSDFQFLQNPLTHNWVILAPRRAKRPDVAKGTEPVCPFCLGREKDEEEVYRVQDGKGYTNWPASHAWQPASIDSRSVSGESDAGWQIRVLPNKFPFAEVHEIIIHSPDHHKNFDELPLSQSELILQTYRNRYLQHQNSGQVYIFHNHGEQAGESLPHPHTQVAVIPSDVKANIPRLDPSATVGLGPAPLSPTDHATRQAEQLAVETDCFSLLCPLTSQWPDEVWILPKKRGRLFGEITDEEITDLAKTLKTLIEILDLRHGHEFPFNFYIYPGGDWYLRLIPRQKSLGGFEIGTNIYVNTQDPRETIAFIKEHFVSPNREKIVSEQQANYGKHV